MTSILAPKATLSRSQVLTMAIATGTTIANLYYSQPILGAMAATFGASSAQAGSIPLLTQAGFAIGLIFVAPLGDQHDRKRLVIALEIMLCLALVSLSVAPSLMALRICALLVGVSATAVQVIVPLAATLASPERRGQVVSLVFTGTLMGILSARIVAGIVADAWGWRIIFQLSAIAAACVAMLIAMVIPAEEKRHGSPSYLKLLASTAAQWSRFATLRRVSFLGALTFGVFCAYWTTLTFQLESAFGFDAWKVGLFGIAAIAGAILSPFAGRMADRIHPSSMQMATLTTLLLGTLLAALGRESLPLLALATIVIDVGMQTTQVSSLAQIYALDPLANSRINTVYIASFFMGGALGTALGILAWHHGGWVAVCALLATMSAAALCIAVHSVMRRNAAGAPRDEREQGS